MNQKQQDSLAKMFYDLGKGFILASVATIFLPHPAPSGVFLLGIIAGCGLIYAGYDHGERAMSEILNNALGLASILAIIVSTVTIIWNRWRRHH